MKKIKITLFLLMLPLLFIIFHVGAMAEGRSIYVGDLIDLKISTRDFSTEELKEKFKAFEIVNIKEEAGGFLITLRTFETGEKKVQLGDKEIVIEVRSTLDEIQRDNVFEGSESPEAAGFTIDWQYVFYVLLITFLITSGICLKRYLKKRKATALTPYQHFIRKTDSILMEEDEYFAKLTSCLKEYLEAVYSCRIKGKTSSEILDIAGSLPGLQESIRDLEAWLKESDRLKFTGVRVSRGKKEELYADLAGLVRRIEAVKGVAS
jgi:hypothetical protein